MVIFTALILSLGIVRSEKAGGMGKLYREGLFTSFLIFLTVWVIVFNISGGYPKLFLATNDSIGVHELMLTNRTVLTPDMVELSGKYNCYYIYTLNGKKYLILGRYLKVEEPFTAFRNPSSNDYLIYSTDNGSLVPITYLTLVINQSKELPWIKNKTLTLTEIVNRTVKFMFNGEQAELNLSERKQFQFIGDGKKLNLTLQIVNIRAESVTFEIEGETFYGDEINLSNGLLNYSGIASLVIHKNGFLYVFNSAPFEVKSLISVEGDYILFIKD